MAEGLGLGVRGWAGIVLVVLGLGVVLVSGLAWIDPEFR